MFRHGILILLLATQTALAIDSDRHQFTGAADLSFYHVNSELDSYLYNGSGKLRYDEEHDGLRLNRIFLDYRGRITNTLSGRLTLNMNNDVEEAIDLTEAFLEWRPVPRSSWRFRTKLGAFYPHLSLENIEPGWSNAYGLTSSVINTWIGEELRTIGAELRVLRDFPHDQHVSLEGAVFYANDPTGAALTWRGWTSHDRQTGISGAIPMPTGSSAIMPWVPAGGPLPELEPFEEIDDRPGFYGGVQWRWGERAMIKYFYYDNHADPEATSGSAPDMAYAWETKFNHLSAQFALPWKLGLLGQWIDGSTIMGPDLGLWHVQDVRFDSTYATLTRQIGRHRIAVRYEWFDLQPHNDPDGITNQDKGNAVALSWLFQFNPKLRFAAEYMQIKSDHCKLDSCSWTDFYGLPQNTKDSQVQLSVRWHFVGLAP